VPRFSRRLFDEPRRAWLAGEPRPVPLSFSRAASFSDTVLTVSRQIVGSAIGGSRRWLPSLTNRRRFTGTLVTGLMLARPVGSFFPQRRTVGAVSLRVLARRGSLVGRSIVGHVPVRRSGAGRRMIRVEPGESLTQLVKQFDGRPGAPFAQCLIDTG
jgi:hypothetical protein